jgi:glycosyltransferase involved in cell wall biosynthesis
LNSNKITVTILTKNSNKHLKTVLEALASFDQVLIYDNGSTDNTLEIASLFQNVTIETGSFLGFGSTHNRATELSKNDWVLSIDSDEVVSPEMLKSIDSLNLEIEAVYSFPRHNYFNGKWIRWCGWYPDRVVRLYNKKTTAFCDSQVHESIRTKGVKKISLDQPIIHYSYESLSDFINKMQTYSDLFAKQHQGKKKSSTLKAIGHGFGAFLKSYLLKRGFLGGKEGFIISTYNGHTAFYKYLKLAEANTRL